MDNFKVEVALRQSWTNLVDLPSSIVSLLYNASVSPQEVIIEIVSLSKEKVYIGWSGMSSPTSMTLGIDPISAQSLNLSEKQSVILNVKIHNGKTSNIMLEPEQFSDWELVEIHAAYIESKLVEQSRCVAINQTLVVYPTRTSSVKLRVTSLGIDQEFALIDPFAEVSIMPKKQVKKSQNVSSSLESGKLPEKMLQSPCVLKRGISIPHLAFPMSDAKSESGEYEVYGNSREFMHSFGACEYVVVSIVSGPNSQSKITNSNESMSQREAMGAPEQPNFNGAIKENKNVVAKFFDFAASPRDTVGLSKNLAIALHVEGNLGYKVSIKEAPKSLGKKPASLTIYPFTPQNKKNDQMAKRFSKETQIEGNQVFLKLFGSRERLTSPITNFCRIPIIPGCLPYGGILAFKRIQDPHSWIKPSSSRSSKYKPRIEIGDSIPNMFSELQDEREDSMCDNGSVYGLEVLLEELESHFWTFKCTGVMIHGSKGAGKTVCLKSLARNFNRSSILHTVYVACEASMNENIDQVRLRVSKWFQEAVWNQPSVIILDNLDKLIPAEVDNSDSTSSQQLTEYLISLMRSLCSQKNTNVSLLVSGASKESFNKIFIQSHIIEKFCGMSAPDKATRATILREYLTRQLQCSLSFDLMDVVLETEGYLPNDLKILSDRMYFQSIQETQLNLPISCERNVTRRDFEVAISEFKPSSLRGVKLQKSGVNWEDIGGMFEAKRVLLETLEWPTKYAPIFAKCPLRLRSGLLLYGYPGCGKTLLASAIAGQCGLNLISIKGPEILNKYIGASEQSVRELFERAQSAKPCILFFDEFDSIAPKRGHDSTGVTDRVVNQMLTQMDGAEGLDGVYVLAATSRPDLIDSALLRPGRLDKSIFCDMPNFDDRLNILKCICQKMSLSDDVRLEDIAFQTDGFSGADLQGLGYNAYLKAVHEVLADEETQATPASKGSNESADFFRIGPENRKSIRTDENVALMKQIGSIIERNDQLKKSPIAATETTKTQIMIRNSHFSFSLKETKSSISASEKSKLSQVYSEFSTGRDGNMPDGSASQEIGGRSTLM